jgi:hypothetical protein
MLEPAFALLGPIALLSVALWWIDRHFRRFDGYRKPALLGLVVELSELDFAGPTIGWWGDHRLHEFVCMRNRTFEYDRLVPRDYCYRVAANELFIAPGMVYRAR